MQALGIIGTVVSAVGTIAGGAIQAQGIRHQAAAQQAALNYQAQQLEMKGKEEQAAAYFDAQEKRREKDLALSALQARGAASGFDATDPTTLQLGSDIEKYGTLQQMMAMYGGYSRRAGLDAEAVGRRAEGRAAVQGARYAAAGSILGGITGGFSRFAQGFSSFGGGSSYRYG